MTMFTVVLATAICTTTALLSVAAYSDHTWRQVRRAETERNIQRRRADALQCEVDYLRAQLEKEQGPYR